MKINMAGVGGEWRKRANDRWSGDGWWSGSEAGTVTEEEGKQK